MKAHKSARSSAILCAAILFSLSQVGCPGPLRPVTEPHRQSWWKEQQEREACITNLMCIGAAKEQWAILNGKQDGDEVIQTEVDSYVKNLPAECPSGGSYTYGKVAELPTCSVPGHALHEATRR